MYFKMKENPLELFRRGARSQFSQNCEESRRRFRVGHGV
jgi:hypothetical protein